MFDTYAAARALRDAGFDEPQAEAAVNMVRDAISEGAATGEDAARLEGKVDTGIADVKADIARLEGKVESDAARLEGKVESEVADVKADIARLEGKVESDAARLEGKVESEVARLEGKVESEVARLEGKVESDIADVKADIRGLETRLTVRMYGGLIATAAVVTTLVKLLS